MFHFSHCSRGLTVDSLQCCMCVCAGHAHVCVCVCMYIGVAFASGLVIVFLCCCCSIERLLCYLFCSGFQLSHRFPPQLPLRGKNDEDISMCGMCDNVCICMCVWKKEHSKEQTERRFCYLYYELGVVPFLLILCIN